MSKLQTRIVTDFTAVVSFMCLTAFFYAANFITVCDSRVIVVASKQRTTQEKRIQQ